MPKKDKNSVERRILDTLIKAVESSGLLPWQRPWVVAHPINLVTYNAHKSEGTPEEVCIKYGYKGINPLLLSLSEFSSPFWFTYKQATDLGWQIRKGEKSSFIVYWNIFEKTVTDDDGDDRIVKIPFLRYYNLFNVEQADPAEGKEPAPIPTITDIDKTDRKRDDIKELLTAPWLAPTTFKGTQAAYIPSQDRIVMPPVDAFKSYAHFYSTWAHEAVHSTGHIDRLGREGIVNPSLFGSEKYGFEELIACVGQAMFCARVGVQNEDMNKNDAAYLKNWLQVLKDDPRMIVRAGSQAQRAVDFIFDGYVKTYGEEDKENDD